MSVYLDSSAFAKLYIDEAGKALVETLLRGDVPVTARHTYVEVRRALHIRLRGAAFQRARERLDSDWQESDVVELDDRVCRAAAELAEVTGVKTLDALHLAAAQRAGGAELKFVTFDARQADAARSLGWPVLGA